MIKIPIKGNHPDSPLDIIHGDTVTFYQVQITTTSSTLIGASLVLEPIDDTIGFKLVCDNTSQITLDNKITYTQDNGIVVDSVLGTIQINQIDTSLLLEVPYKGCLKVSLQDNTDPTIVKNYTILEFNLNIVKC